MKKFSQSQQLLHSLQAYPHTLQIRFLMYPLMTAAYQAVSDLSDQGVVEGYPDGTFKGERNMTRYELVSGDRPSDGS